MGSSLCENCRNFVECFFKGVSDKDKCADFDPLTLEEILERDRFVSRIMVGPCPKCGGENTVDCDGDPSISDPTVGHCLECDAYWCIECKKTLKDPFKCGHWAICEACSKQNGYMPLDEFMDEICQKCDFWEDGCTLENFEECEHIQYRCPHESNPSECPKIRKWKSKPALPRNSTRAP